MVRDINFALYEGEIVGFAGLMGAGRTETTRAIFGVDPKDSGEIILEGKTLKSQIPMMQSAQESYWHRKTGKGWIVYQTEHPAQYCIT